MKYPQKPSFIVYFFSPFSPGWNILSRMARVFGRKAPPELEGLAAAVREMLDDKFSSDRHVAQNLLNDDRISEERAAEFVRITGFPTRTTLTEALTDYVSWYVSRNADATYLAQSNSINFIEPIPPGLELAHVINVRSLLRWATTYPTTDFDSARVAAAEEAVTSTMLPERQRLEIIDEFLKAYSVRLNQRPIWAASWKIFELHMDSGKPESWNQCVGIWRDREALQMVLRYPARLVSRLLRPTQLESGNNGYHHPSPGALVSALGGFALSLCARSEPFPGLLREFIHPPVQFDHTHWLAAGEMCGRAQDGKLDDGKINEFRRLHRQRITEEFPDDSKDWWHDSAL